MSESEKTIHLELGVWYNEQTNHIHVSTQAGNGFISTVNADPTSKRGNPNLFFKLACVLRDAGKPHPQIPD